MSALGISTRVLGSFLAPATRVLTYEANVLAPTAMLGPDALAQLYWAGRLGDNWLRFLLAEQGLAVWGDFKDQQSPLPVAWEEWLKLTKPQPPLEVARRKWLYDRRPGNGYPNSTDRLNDLLKRQGFYDQRDRDLILRTPNLPSETDIRSWYWQGLIDQAGAEDWLERVGWLDREVTGLLTSVRTPLPMDRLIYLWQIGQLSDDQLSYGLHQYGFIDEAAISRFKASSLQQPIPQQAVQFAALLATDDSFAKRWGLDVRFPSEWKAAWQAAGQWWGEGVSLPDQAGTTVPRLPLLQWRSHWQLPGLAQAMRLYQYVRPYNVARWAGMRDEEGRQPFRNLKPFTVTQLGDAANASGVAPEAVLQMAAAMYVPLSRRDILRGLTVGILDPQRALESYRDAGYSPSDASLLTNIQTAYIDYQRQAPLRAAQSRLIKEQIDAELSLYQSGGQDRPTTIGALVGLGYPVELATSAVDLSPAVWTVRFAARAQQQALQSGLRSVLGLYQLGAMPDVEATSQLAALGIPAQSAAVLLGEEKLKQRQRVARAGLAAVRADYRRGLLTTVQVSDKLLAFGLTPEAARSYAAEWAAGMSDVRRRLSTAEIGKFVVDGIMSLADARHRLVNLGWSAGDIPLWLAEWQAKAAAAAAKKQKASQPKPTKTQPAPTNGTAVP